MGRHRRRRQRRSPLAVVVLLLALAVVAVALGLIVRGDTTPRPKHASVQHRSGKHTAATAEPVATRLPVAQAHPVAPPAAAPTTAASAAAQGASAAPQAPAGARLAIIIDDCGQWLETERAFIALPVAITLSVLPHVRYGDAIARDARAAGKGVMLHLPMEPRSGADPGPGRITTAMDDDAIVKAVAGDLASVPLADGVNNHEGSRATADDRVMRAVSGVLAARHVFFIDSRTSSATVAQRDASAAGIPTARRDVFLDDVAELGATETQLRTAADLARSRGSAIAIGHPRPTTLEAVRALLPELQQSGVTFVLASELVR